MNDPRSAGLRADEIGRHRDKLLRFARRRLNDPAQAEDAVQDALIAALEGVGGYSGGSSTATWLTGILKHKIVDSVRKSALHRTQEGDPDGIASNFGDPVDALHQNGFVQQVARCMDGLPERTARVFFLRGVLELDTNEVCAELSITASNCCVLVHRARTRLREHLGNDRLAAPG